MNRKQYMKNSLKYLIILIVLIFICLSVNYSASSTSYYFCFDSYGFKMFSIKTDSYGHRLIRDSYYDQFYSDDETFLGYHNEENQTIAIYKLEFNIDNDPSALYFLWNFDFSSNILYYDLVNDISPKKFHEWTKLSPTPENIKKYNVKPELLKYIPDKKLAPSNIFMTKTKWTFNCQSMSYLRYKVQRVIFIFYDMLASMG